MSLITTTHLNFRGDARAALAFYQAVFGGHQVIVTYKEAGSTTPPEQADQVMWGQVVADNGFRVMAYDVQAAKPWNPGENAVYVAVAATTAEEISAHWHKLAEGATIIEPIAPSPWSPLYGMLKDRFGVTWVLSVASAGY